MKFYNTLSRKKEIFIPIEPQRVRLYSCGLTVYDEPHIGNWSNYIAWDTLVRVLRDAGYIVDHVQNYTDVGHLVSDDDAGEDKMVKAAKRERKTAWDIAEHYIARAETGMQQLNITRPDHLPRATDYIPGQIAFVEGLERKGFTYTIPHEGVYFDTSKLSDYGKLARLDIDGQEAGKRVATTGKRAVTDFALWKFSPKDEARDMEWPSPWGKGFPGWHLECSVMSREILGDTIDIHTGGIDHIPIHHTNEIAQTEALTGKLFVHYWLHRNFMKVDGHKMSKSLGNIYTLDDLARKGFSPLDFRMLILQSHYRTESNFSWENLAAARQRRLDLQAFADLRFQYGSDFSLLGDEYFLELTTEIRQALQNDLNTPQAFSVLSRVIDHVAEYGGNGIHVKHQADFEAFLQKIDTWFGLGLLVSNDISQEARTIIAQRDKARQERDFKTADQKRSSLAESGIQLNDLPHGSIWSRTI